jgi:hypothetical protein
MKFRLGGSVPEYLQMVSKVICSAIGGSNDIVYVTIRPELKGNIYPTLSTRAAIARVHSLQRPLWPARLPLDPLNRRSFPIGTAIESNQDQSLTDMFTELPVVEYTLSVILRVEASDELLIRRCETAAACHAHLKACSSYNELYPLFHTNNRMKVLAKAWCGTPNSA